MKFKKTLNEALRNIPQELPGEDKWGHKSLFSESETLTTIISTFGKLSNEGQWEDFMYNYNDADVITMDYNEGCYDCFETGIYIGRAAGVQTIYKVHYTYDYYFIGEEAEVIERVKRAIERHAPDVYQKMFGNTQ